MVKPLGARRSLLAWSERAASAQKTRPDFAAPRRAGAIPDLPRAVAPAGRLRGYEVAGIGARFASEGHLQSRLPAMAKAQRKNKERVTVQTIADRAGVSIAAVSSVLTNRQVERRISSATVAKVRAISAKLGYLPNINARRLRSGNRQKNNIILAFVTSFEAPLNLASHLIMELRNLVHGSDLDTRGMTFSVMVEMFPAGQLAAMPGLLTGDHFNAAIITNTTPVDDHFLIHSQLPYPVVLVNRTVPRYACVVEDPAAGALAAKVLIQRKSRKLAVLSGRPLTQTTQRRLASFRQGVARELLPPPAEIVADELTEASAYAAISRWFDRGEMIDGLYAVTDGLAVGAYRAIKERGWLIPRDVAVVGVGDYDLSAFFDPPLSTVGVTRGILGKEAGRSLLRQLEQPGFALRKVVIPVYSELRASTGH